MRALFSNGITHCVAIIVSVALVRSRLGLHCRRLARHYSLWREQFCESGQRAVLLRQHGARCVRWRGHKRSHAAAHSATVSRANGSNASAYAATDAATATNRIDDNNGNDKQCVSRLDSARSVEFRIHYKSVVIYDKYTQILPSDPLERIGETPALDQNDNQIVLIVGVSVGFCLVILIVFCIVLLANMNRKKKLDGDAKNEASLNSLEEHSEYASAGASYQSTLGAYTAFETETNSVARDTALYDDVSQILQSEPQN